MSAMNQEAGSGGILWRNIVPAELPLWKPAETRIVKMNERHKYIQWLLAEWDKQPRRPLPGLFHDLRVRNLVQAAIHDDNEPTTMPAPHPALRGHFFLGSSGGWLATSDDRGQIYLVNPATAEQHALPHINTMGIFLPCADGSSFCFVMNNLFTARFGDASQFINDSRWASATLTASHMSGWLYRKVVLSASPRPGRYSAMLITHRNFGAPAFATAEDPAWRLAQSHAGVEDAIHHDGQFYSVSYSGVVEAWKRDAESGVFTSTAVALVSSSSCRKYLVAVRGRLTVVLLKYPEGPSKKQKYPEAFKVHVLGHDGQWKETSDNGLVDRHDQALAQYKRHGYAYLEADIGYDDDDEPYLKVDEEDLEYKNARLLREERAKMDREIMSAVEEAKKKRFDD